jgi:hypothetical protein
MLGAPAQAQYDFILFQSTDTCKAEFSPNQEIWHVARMGHGWPAHSNPARSPHSNDKDLSGEMNGLSNSLPYAGVPNRFGIALFLAEQNSTRLPREWRGRKSSMLAKVSSVVLGQYDVSSMHLRTRCAQFDCLQAQAVDLF